MVMSKEVLVCCSDCKLLELEYISMLNTECIEGERFTSYGYSSNISEEDLEKLKEEHRIPHHELSQPSGCCQTKIQMCQHEECFTTVTVGLGMGTYGTQRKRIKGQAQLNPYGMCEHYKRKWWKLLKPRKAVEREVVK
jgi:hypothetical protein